MFTFTSHLHLVPGERDAAVDADDEVGFFGGEVAVGVGVLAEGDLDVVRGGEVGREGEGYAASESGPVRHGDID